MFVHVPKMTVNLAARLQNQGLAGRVQVSAATTALIEGELAVEPRDCIEVKGLGRQEAWLLVGRPQPGR